MNVCRLSMDTVDLYVMQVLHLLILSQKVAIYKLEDSFCIKST